MLIRLILILKVQYFKQKLLMPVFIDYALVTLEYCTPCNKRDLTGNQCTIGFLSTLTISIAYYKDLNTRWSRCVISRDTSEMGIEPKHVR